MIGPGTRLVVIAACFLFVGMGAHTTGTHRYIHNRCDQNARAGLHLKTVAFGLALNGDEYGREAGPSAHPGVFIRKELP